MFALKFKETVGPSPTEYLAHWRMFLADERLKNSEDRILVIARSLGNESETSFSIAFKKIMGCPPHQFGRSLHAASDAPSGCAPPDLYSVAFAAGVPDVNGHLGTSEVIFSGSDFLTMSRISKSVDHGLSSSCQAIEKIDKFEVKHLYRCGMAGHVPSRARESLSQNDAGFATPIMTER